MTKKLDYDPSAEEKAAAEESERLPLPAGHPIAWRVLTEGTLLEGSRYPLPVFL